MDIPSGSQVRSAVALWGPSLDTAAHKAEWSGEARMKAQLFSKLSCQWDLPWSLQVELPHHPLLSDPCPTLLSFLHSTFHTWWTSKTFSVHLCLSPTLVLGSLRAVIWVYFMHSPGQAWSRGGHLFSHCTHLLTDVPPSSPPLASSLWPECSW